MGNEKVARLLLENGADTEAKNIDGETALLWTADNGFEAIVQLLLDKGADIEAKDNHKVTALFWADRHGFEAIVRLLLRNERTLQQKMTKEQQFYTTRLTMGLRLLYGCCLIKWQISKRQVVLE